MVHNHKLTTDVQSNMFERNRSLPQRCQVAGNASCNAARLFSAPRRRSSPLLQQLLWPRSRNEKPQSRMKKKYGQLKFKKIDFKHKGFPKKRQDDTRHTVTYHTKLRLDDAAGSPAPESLQSVVFGVSCLMRCFPRCFPRSTRRWSWRSRRPVVAQLADAKGPSCFRRWRCVLIRSISNLYRQYVECFEAIELQTTPGDVMKCVSFFNSRLEIYC